MNESTPDNKLAADSSTFSLSTAWQLSLGIGCVYVILQCMRVGYLPEFDWTAIASITASAFLVGILATTIFACVILLPAVFLQNTETSQTLFKTDVNLSRRAKIITVFAAGFALYQLHVLGLLWIFSHDGPWQILEATAELLHFPTSAILAAAVLCPVILPAARLASVTLEATQKKLSFRYISELVMITVAMASSSGVLLMLAIFYYGDLGPAIIDIQAFALVTIMVTAANSLALYRPRKRIFYVIAACVLLLVSSWKVSHISFRVLGLGNRTIEHLVVDAKYRLLLEQAGLRGTPHENDIMLHDVGLCLRLGSELVICKIDPQKRTQIGGVVAIPRDAIHGLALKPQQNQKQSVPAGK